MAEKKITFETALNELNNIVKKMEDEDIPLDEALKLFGKGVELTEKCNKILDDAKQKITIVENRGNE